MSIMPMDDDYPISTISSQESSTNDLDTDSIDTTNTSESSLTESVESKYMPPWTKPYIIGIGGASGSGKTSVAAKIVSSINVPWTVLISLDNFYNPLSPEERQLAFNNNFDFDDPAAIDLDLAYECLLNLKEGRKTVIPKYNFVEHNRVPDQSITIYAASVIVIEGIYGLFDRRLLDLMDLKIYVDADLDVCLARRLTRDIISRGRDLEGCLISWQKFVRPNTIKYVRQTLHNADVIIPSTGDNTVAVNLLITHIKTKLELKSKQHLKELIHLGLSDTRLINEIPVVHQLNKGHQIRSLKTMLLNKNLSRADFIFYFDRIASILLSKVLDHMSYTSKVSIETQNGHQLADQILCRFDQITAVNIIPSGDCFMHSLKKTIPNISVSKILIQSDSKTGEPQLHCEYLAPNISQFKQVYLMESQIITGTSIIMAIRVLLDHDVKIENITIVLYMATEVGIKRILNAFGDKINIFVAHLVSNKDIHDGNKQWALKRFVDVKYFGC
ncbi:hypothetical protein TBLA_0A06720 [Henningerozyma blattae CBS 6284]|uniref:Uridine kinase n=1 Tax=Henningerozyma blattae (strain ATCC 34711 / CBS 6284 / DSM 70876 / NBRC 10599 / NRRL Y-10934 / UCD 77-7) TaxID=1071380 RepID=I2GWG2_HENB6|nr:hypothetical protein TBLA_0A06720 [Tetrapisispora blattae CBS 6284]CCH58464.1 hypothetical protein TBLA_0A06720 [Tetrapisispora blattae CBS 6284]